MGCSLSCGSSQSFDCVRVIHINGYIQDFAGPVTVGQVAGASPAKHVLCSSAHLLSYGAPPLRPGDPLQPGRLYFLLPHTVFQCDSSPVDLASLLTRLTAVARRGCPAAAAAPPPPGPGQKVAGPGLGLGLGLGVADGERMACSRARTWKPDLDTIQERASLSSSNSAAGSFSVREGLA